MSAGIGSMASGIGPMLPDSLRTGLTVWLDAYDYTGTAWPNRGSAPAPSIVGSPAPLKVEGGVNGRPLVRFTNAQGMIRGTGMCTDAAVPLTVQYIGRTRGPVKGRMFANVYPTYNVLIGTHGSGEPVLYDNGWAGWIQEWGTLPTDWKSYGMISAAGLQRLWVNNILVTSTTTSNGHDNRYALSGYEAATGGETSDCDIAEVLVWNRTLTTGEYTEAWNYLSAKWLDNIAISLAAITPNNRNYNLGAPTITCYGTGFVQGDTQYTATNRASSTVFATGLATVASSTQCSFTLPVMSQPYTFGINLRSNSKSINTATQVYAVTGISPG